LIFDWQLTLPISQLLAMLNKAVRKFAAKKKSKTDKEEEEVDMPAVPLPVAPEVKEERTPRASSKKHKRKS
jgi:hypothetical protein